MNLNAAGIEVGATEHWVAVPADRDAQPVQRFGAFTAALYPTFRTEALILVHFYESMEMLGIRPRQAAPRPPCQDTIV